MQGQLGKLDRIRQRAHAIWESEGRPEGRERDHWDRACQEIEAEDRLPPPAELNPGTPEGWTRH